MTRARLPSSIGSLKLGQLWPASTTMRSCKPSRLGEPDQDALPPPRKIKVAEFELLSCGQPTIGKNEHDSVFYAEEYPREHWNADLTQDLERVLVVHRLRTVTALVGYTRFDYISPDIDGEFDLNLRPASSWESTQTGSRRLKTRGRASFSSSARTRWINGKSNPPCKNSQETWRAATVVPGTRHSTSGFLRCAVRHASLAVASPDQCDLSRMRLPGGVDQGANLRQ